MNQTLALSQSNKNLDVHLVDTLDHTGTLRYGFHTHRGVCRGGEYKSTEYSRVSASLAMAKMSTVIRIDASGAGSFWFGRGALWITAAVLSICNVQA